jgi:hypothetical protein
LSDIQTRKKVRDHPSLPRSGRAVGDAVQTKLVIVSGGWRSGAGGGMMPQKIANTLPVFFIKYTFSLFFSSIFLYFC